LDQFRGSKSLLSPRRRATFPGVPRLLNLHLMISADKAIPLGLLINEIVTNAAKHGYPDGSGEIQVSGERRGADLHVEVSDQGIGLPTDFDIDQPRASLGFKVIKSLLAQLEGRIAVASNRPKGVTIQLDLPLDTNEG
jgi:two-component system, sensor histidine kinase PdtaS